MSAGLTTRELQSPPMTSARSLAAAGRLVAEIAGGLVGQGVPAFEDAGALDDPVRIVAEAGVQMRVGDDRVGDVTASREHAHAGQAAATRSGRWGAFFAHRSSTD